MTESNTAPEGQGGEPAATATPAPTADVAGLHKEAAAYRVQRNDALRQAHAYGVILKAHGIDTASVTKDRLESLPISGGAVDGQFDYTPPKIAPVPKGKVDSGPSKADVLTRESLETMSQAEINSRWDEVKKLLSS